MGDISENRVYVVQSDPAALAAANRPLQIALFAVIAVFLTAVCCAWWAGTRAWLPGVVTFWVVGVCAGAFLCFRTWSPLKDSDIWIGGDFIAGRPDVSSAGLAVAKYEDITRVVLDVSKGRITGATIRARRMNVVFARWIRDPAIVVREVFQHAPEHVKWSLSRWPFTGLSREQVTALIEASHPPDITCLLPQGVRYASAEDLFSRENPSGGSLFARLFAESPTRTVEMLSLKTPTPVGRYVNLMLLQMLDIGEKTRILRRSEPLPILTFRAETAEAPSLDEVLDDLKNRCSLNTKQPHGPTEGVYRISVQEVPYDITCRFDDSNDASCEIRLEKRGN